MYRATNSTPGRLSAGRGEHPRAGADGRRDVDEQRPRGAAPSAQAARSSSWAASTRRAYGSSRAPSAVSDTARVVRTNSSAPQLPLQAPDITAQCLLGDEQPGGGAGEVQFLGDGDEGAQQPGVRVVGHARQSTPPALTTRVREWALTRCWTPPEGAHEDRGMPRSTALTRRPNPYIRLFRTPGALAFTVGNLLARLPMGMFSVSAVIMIAGSRGSYALAGGVTATGLAATASVAPWTARLVDRYGQARIAVPATAVAVLGSLALLLCVHLGAPNWTLFAAYAATATTPNTGGMSRARWAHLHRNDPPLLHTANSFEQAADELCFMLGPVAAAFLCSALFPEAGTLVGRGPADDGRAALRRPARDRAARRTAYDTAKSPVRTRGFAPLLAVFLATGAVFGSLEVVTIAYADGLGHRCGGGRGARPPGGRIVRRRARCTGRRARPASVPRRLLAASRP